MDYKITNKRRYTKPNLGTAYTVERSGVEFQVKQTANAWWLDKVKVKRLIEALEVDSGIKYGCIYADITLRQYKYFISQHDEFREFIRMLRAGISFSARVNVAMAIMSGDVNLSREYLEKHPD